MALTDTAVRGAKPDTRPFKIYDREGLFLLINPVGSKLWRWRYRFDGKEKLMALGEYPLVGLGQARELHLAARKILVAGTDPMAERKAKGKIVYVDFSKLATDPSPSGSLQGFLVPSNTGIEIHMPTVAWNSNFAMVRCGGMCGAIQVIAGGSVGLLWAVLALSDKDQRPIVSSADLTLINNPVLAACDENDGLKDGGIAVPGSCKFDPHTLVCKPGSSTSCIPAAQADAVAKVYEGPHNSKGRPIYRGFMRGSERGWEGSFLPLNGVASIYAPFILSMNRYLNYLPAPGPAWQFSDFNFDRDPDRMAIYESLFTAANPDLRSFRDRGGRMIFFQGWNDAAVEPQATTNFYQAVEREMGGSAATQQFFRLFMLPGTPHCQGGAGAYAFDYLGALEDWVECGNAPDQIRAVRPVDPKGGMYPRACTPAPGVMDHAIYARPLFPYPAVPTYNGHGNPNLAQSFLAK